MTMFIYPSLKVYQHLVCRGPFLLVPYKNKALYQPWLAEQLPWLPCGADISHLIHACGGPYIFTVVYSSFTPLPDLLLEV